jgi:protein-S-isoprenylcysteine O-methyltransferase Ste14
MASADATADPRRARETRLRPMGPRGEGWIGLQMLFEVGLFVIAPFTGPAWGGPLRAVTVAVGFVLLIGGVLVFAWGAWHLGASFSVWVTPRPGASFVRSGPYRFTRHPICTAQVAMCLGWALIAASPVALALVPVVAWYLDRYKLAREEVTLLARYPEYADFVREVPHRMWPSLPRGRAAHPTPSA